VAVRFQDSLTVVQGGSGPNPVDSFSLAVKIADTVPGDTDAVSFAFAFPDSVPAQTETVKLGLTYPDTVQAVADALLSLGLRIAETTAVQNDVATFLIALTLADTVGLPGDALTLGLPFADTVGALTDARASTAQFFLSGSVNTSQVTNPGNANGKNDGTSSSQQTAPAAAATSRMTSNVGAGIAAGTIFSTAIYRGWFVATVTVPTSTISITAHSSSALFTDVTVMTTTATLNSSGGTFTFDLVAAGINTLAKLQSMQVFHNTADAVAGVTPAVLTVDAGAVELGTVL
jgi:hypothetical protein